MVAKQRDGLVRENIHDEILVFNRDRSEATALNQSAALVFDMCDGTNAVESMRAALDDAGLGPATHDTVWLALTELAEAGLVELLVPPARHMGRRELLKKLGVGAAAAAAILPVVETIAAPSAAAQGSGIVTTVAVTPAPSGGAGQGSGAVTTVAMTPAPSVATPAPSVATPAPSVATPAPSVATPAPSVATPAPSVATPAPSVPAPTPSPTGAPTVAPTPSPTGAPTVAPTPSPTGAPTVAPTPSPTGAPTVAPTPSPTGAPAPSAPSPAGP